jgi:hypothetical protein
MFFGFITSVLNPQKIQEKDSKKFYLTGYPGTKSPCLRRNFFSKFFWLQLIPSTTIENKNK